MAQAVEIVDELQRMREAALERGLVTAAADGSPAAFEQLYRRRHETLGAGDSVEREVAEVLADPRFSRLLEHTVLVDYWKQYGYPDDCRAGEGDRALVCDP